MAARLAPYQHSGIAGAQRRARCRQVVRVRLFRHRWRCIQSIGDAGNHGSGGGFTAIWAQNCSDALRRPFTARASGSRLGRTPAGLMFLSARLKSLLVGTAPVGRGRLSRFIAPRDFCSGPSIRRFFNLVEAWTVGAFAAENKRIAGALGEPRANKWTLVTMPA